MADQRGRRDGAPKKADPRGGGPRKAGAPSRGAGSERGAQGRGKAGQDRRTSDRKPGDRSPADRTERDRKPGERRQDDRRQGERRGPSAGRGPERGAGARRMDSRDAAPKRERAVDQETYDGPVIPDDVTGAELSPSVRAHLKGLPEKLAARVARHLAAAGRIVDEDPETAYKHTLAAKARAPRIAVVREAVGESAYAAGHYAEALSELRAAKRMNGATSYLPIMADCHRALGNPTRALELAKSPSVARFAPEAKAEMTIVEAGARRDMGQLDAALRTLEVAPLNNKSRESWVVRLRYAYADTLEQAGRLNDALTWFHKTNAIDAEELTDAAERAEDLEKRVERD
ncbi:tetratricopeptide repeat protein [Nocardioides sp. zg-536]|uniref:Tetratricopeptide repeat protein n=1 Tax=Nocardioides faecalis TaxID=2803858 RepID=A0A938Y9N4_9ACTN|nr:tetratricopeptide repeat protein [Nocardioides faecalis]MBM9461737.1 tetratricopeptide repeat protein [Nocardioides faecalis]QVI59899.1 tetratricopeptide repeat protein [Nocardioides faecalis]